MSYYRSEEKQTGYYPADYSDPERIFGKKAKTKSHRDQDKNDKPSVMQVNRDTEELAEPNGMSHLLYSIYLSL
jgi:hypothetical protein